MVIFTKNAKWRRRISKVGKKVLSLTEGSQRLKWAAHQIRLCSPADDCQEIGSVFEAGVKCDEF